MRLTAFLAAALMASQIQANQATPDYTWVNSVNPTTISANITIRKQALPVLVFDQMMSIPGQTEQSFAKEVSERLHAFTETTNFEGCGQIHYNAKTQQYGVQLSTNFSQIACFVPNLSLVDFNESVASIHSHPHVDNFRANPQDLKVQKIFGNPRQRVIHSNKEPGFSARDLMGGAGYLVDQGHMFYHNGQQSVVSLGTLTPTQNTEVMLAQTPPSIRPGP